MIRDVEESRSGRFRPITCEIATSYPRVLNPCSQGVGNAFNFDQSRVKSHARGSHVRWSVWVLQARVFDKVDRVLFNPCVFPQRQSKNYNWKRLTFRNKDPQFLEGLEEFFRGNSRITSDCRVCSILKTLFGCLYAGRNWLVFLARATAPPPLPPRYVQPCSTLVKSYYSSEERIISFERTKTNHDKQQSIALHSICINFQVVFFENNFREFGTLDGVCEEIIKVHIFIESRQEYF